MILISWIGRRLFPLLAGMLTAFTILTVTWFIGVSENREQAQDEHLQTLHKMSTVRARLEGTLTAKILLLKSIVSYISIKGDIDRETFQSFAAGLVAGDNVIRNVTLLKGTVIVDVYPLKGQERALGVDLALVQDQRDTLQRAIETKEPVIAGPLELVQGGTGIISRIPIFLTPPGKTLGDGAYWGQTSVVIMQENLFHQVGLVDPSSGLRYALRGKDGLGAKGDIFWGDETVLESSPIIMDVTLPGGTWQMAAVPTAGWDARSASLFWIYAIGGFLSVFAGWMTWSLLVAKESLKQQLAIQRTLAEKARESETKYRTLYESANDAMFIIKEGEITDCNTASENIFGCEGQQLLGKAPHELSPPLQPNGEDSREKSFERTASVLSGKPQFFEWKHCRYDGTPFDAEVSLISVEVNGETLIQATIRDITERKKAEEALTNARDEMEQRVADRTVELSILNERLAQDITERKKVGEALRKSEERLELALKGADLGLWDYNLQTGDAFVNARRAEMVGYKLEEAEPHFTWWGKQVHPEDLDKVRKAFNRHLAGNTPLYECEQRLRHKSGQYIWILARGKVLEWDRQGNPVRIVGTSLDITDRKRAEEALQAARNELESRVEQRTAELTSANEQLREQIDERKKVEEALRKSEERYRINFENVKDVILSLNAELEVMDVTPSIEKTLGYLPGDLVGKAFTDLNLLEPSGLLAALEDTRRVLCGETLENRVYSFIHKNGTVRFGEVSGAPLAKEGTIIGLVAVGRDITERKKAEESLLDAELRYEGLIETTQTGFVELDASGRVTQANDVYSRMAGASRSEDIIGRSVLDWTAPECLLENEAAVRRCSIQGHISDFETTYLRADGSRARILINATTEDGPDGLRIATLCRDITERKMMEEALREANLVVENSPVVLFRWRAGEGWPVTMVSKNVKQFGYDQKELLAGAVPFASMVHPEDFHRLNREIQDYSANWADRFEQEYRIVTKDGQIRWVDDRTLVERNDEGEIVSYQGIVIDITQRKDVEKSLHEKEKLLERILDASPVGINYVRNRYIVWSNRAWEQMFGFKHSDEYVGKSTRILYQSDEKYEKTGEAYYSALRDDVTTETDVTLLRSDGSAFDANVRVRIAERTNSEVFEAVVAVSDISNRKLAEAEREKLQQQLLQAQKMESVGRLAGGVAHDFNNMLSAILGHVELAMMGLNPSEPIHARLNAIKESALRSADLVRQLLAFARRQTVAPKILDVNDTVAGMLSVLRRLIGEDIDLVWMPGPQLWPVKIDPSQIDQILANLCVNARDAITGVGKVTIESENVSFDDAYCAAHPHFMCGDYVLLAASDDGCGMSKEVLDFIFEPFFTTKELDKGTGLGLATVYGIVKQNEGFINVYSEPSKGTTFKVYLPRFVGEAVEPHTEQLTPELPKGSGEVVLLVEDDEVLLSVGREMLEQLGYNVLTAETPSEALRQVRENSSGIQLVITDVVMPEMNGRDLAKSIDDIRPGQKCLFTSGYTTNVIAHHGVLDEGVEFLQKPFSLHELAIKVRKILSRERACSAND
jgi:two-component system, cell cycle sensor histidine kinase and response regulator CckA